METGQFAFGTKLLEFRLVMSLSICIKLSTYLLVLATVLGGCRDRLADEVEQKIAGSETLSRIDQICREFPKLKSFALEKKGIYGNSTTSGINYQYIAHLPFEEVRTFYQNPRLREDYSFGTEDDAQPLITEISFRRDEVSINIENRPPSGIVNIGCSIALK